MYAVAVLLSRDDSGQICVPDSAVHLGHRDPAFLAFAVQQTQLHGLSYLRENGKVGPNTVKGRTERKPGSRPHTGRAGRWRGSPPVDGRPCRRLLLTHGIAWPVPAGLPFFVVVRLPPRMGVRATTAPPPVRGRCCPILIRRRPHRRC